MATTPDSNDDSTDATERIGGDAIDGDGTYPFAGLTRYGDRQAITLPENVWNQQSSLQYWARNQVAHGTEEEGVERDIDPSVLPERGLNSLQHELPRAEPAEVSWHHPRTGEAIKTEKHNAIINPQKVENIAEIGGEPVGTYAEAIAAVSGEDLEYVEAIIADEGINAAKDELLDAEEERVLDMETLGDDALFYIPTDEYTIINPQTFLDPLCEVLREEEMGDSVFGEVRLSRNGGRGTLDAYFADHEVEAPCFPDDRDPVVVGLEVQWDFYGDWSVRAAGTGIDFACTNAIHKLTDREIVKHAGDVDDRVDWTEMWENLLVGIEEKTDQLAQIIQMASEETLDFGDLPDDLDHDHEDPWTALYAYAGLPEYLADVAGRRLQSQAESAYNPTFWELHSAATYAVTHESNCDRDAGGGFDQQARVANEFLFNPPRATETVVGNFQQSIEESDTIQAEEGGAHAQIETATESVREKKETFNEWEEQRAQLAPAGADPDAE